MVYSIDSVHLNNGHMYPMQFMQIFGSASCVQQLIIPERLNQIYIVHIVGKRRFLAFQRCVTQANLSLRPISNLKDRNDRSSTCERKSVVGINTTVRGLTRGRIKDPILDKDS